VGTGLSPSGNGPQHSQQHAALQHARRTALLRQAGRQAGRALVLTQVRALQAQAHLIEMVKCMLASRSVDLAMWTEVVVRLSQARLQSTPL
jgi:hypothetical protein